MIPDIEGINRRLVGLQKRQDETMAKAREIVRLAGEAVAAIHAKKMAKAMKKLKDAAAKMKRLKAVEGDFLYYSSQAHQEYVEASTLYRIVADGKMPSMKELGEDPVNYMLGIMDVVGELKREVFERMRERDSGAANRYYSFMKEIYEETLPMRFANALMPNFRKKQDVARIQLEGVDEALVYAAERRSK